MIDESALAESRANLRAAAEAPRRRFRVWIGVEYGDNCCEVDVEADTFAEAEDIALARTQMVCIRRVDLTTGEAEAESVVYNGEGTA